MHTKTPTKIGGRNGLIVMLQK